MVKSRLSPLFLPSPNQPLRGAQPVALCVLCIALCVQGEGEGGIA